MIQFENVSKAFGNKQILKNVSFTLEDNETLVLVGPSGTGKSVSIKHIIGLLKPDSGRVLINNKDLNNFSNKARYDFLDNLGVLFQSGALLAWLNVFDNIALPLREKNKLSDKIINQKVEETLKLVGLEDARDKMPNEISGGMQKRAALARAIIIEPKIMLYDEPTSGLDPVMSRKIDHLILKMKENFQTSSVVVTHDLISAFAIADKIAILNEAELLYFGNIDGFKNHKSTFIQEFIKAQEYH